MKLLTRVTKILKNNATVQCDLIATYIMLSMTVVGIVSKIKYTH